ncbi:MAG: hypothetical protein QM504_14285, partial [Pseudomonadota bacterium]
MSQLSMKYRHMVAIFGVLSLFVYSTAQSDVLILTPDNEKANIIAQKIKSKLHNKTVIISNDPNAVIDPELVITLGSEYLRTHNDKINAPTIASFVTPSEYSASTRFNTLPSEPIYSVVSPQSLMSFLEDTFGSARVGYIYTGEKDTYITELEIISSYSDVK